MKKADAFVEGRARSLPERSSDSTLPALTFATTHNLLMQILRRDLGPQAKERTVIDVPCGSGALAVRMRDLGLRVTCSDIDAGNFQAKEFELVLADLNRPLPFADQSFDVVVSIAGLQRVCFPQVAIGEFWRILKPGGMLYLGVTHHASLKKRLNLLFYGTLGGGIDRPSYRQTVFSPEANFRFPLTYVRVEHLLRVERFAIERLYPDRSGVLPYLLFPITAGIWMASRLKALRSRTHDRCYRDANTVAMLRAKAYIVATRKSERLPSSVS